MELTQLAQYGGIGVALAAIGLAGALAVLANRSNIGLQEILRNHLEHDVRGREAVAEALQALHISMERMRAWLEVAMRAER